MKTLKTVSMMFAALIFVFAASVQAQDFRTSNGGPTRSFLGLPVPQQWSGARPTSLNQNPGGIDRSYNPRNQNAGTCPNGRCTTGNYQTGYATNSRMANGKYTNGTCGNCNCPAGACASGLCASGQCPACANGQCVGCENGQCANGQCANGQCSSRNCPNGQCPQNQYPSVRSNSNRNYGVQENWNTRATRTSPADPYRRAETDNAQDNWTPRAAVQTLNHALNPSRYNRDDLDLRRPYFNNQSGELNDTRSGDQNSVSRDIRAPRPSDRSMFGAPVDRAPGFVQI